MRYMQKNQKIERPQIDMQDINLNKFNGFNLKIKEVEKTTNINVGRIESVNGKNRSATIGL